MTTSLTSPLRPPRERLHGYAVTVLGLGVMLFTIVSRRAASPSAPLLEGVVLVLAAARMGGVGPALCAAIASLAALLVTPMLGHAPYEAVDLALYALTAAFVGYFGAVAPASQPGQSASGFASTSGDAWNLMKLEAVLSSLEEGVAITGARGELLHINDPGLRISGLASRGEATAVAPLVDVYTLTGEKLAIDEWPLRRVGRGETVERVELRLHRRDLDRESFVAYAGGPVFDREGNRVAGVVTFQDITAEKRVARERESLVASEHFARTEAERANRVKDEFLSIVSHELRSPLNVILGWTHLLQRPNRTADQTDKALAIMDRHARALAQTVSDLFDASRLASGQVTLDLSPLSITSLVERAVDHARAGAASKGVELSEVSSPGNLQVRADASRLSQVLDNILSNSVKFTPPGGTISVSIEEREETVDIRVKDSGQGISTEFLPYVFDRFRQADASSARPYAGLGLGLTIAERIVALHHGSIRAESDGEGRGASFTVSLPRTPPPAERS